MRRYLLIFILLFVRLQLCPPAIADDEASQNFRIDAPALFPNTPPEKIRSEDTPKDNEPNGKTPTEDQPSYASISGINLYDGAVYERPLIRTDLLFVAKRPLVSFEINDDKIRANKNNGIYRLRYIFELEEGANTIQIKAYTDTGSVVSRDYTVFFPEKNLDLYQPKSFFITLAGGIFHDSNPLYFNGADEATTPNQNSTQSADGDFYWEWSGRAYYFYETDFFMKYEFTDVAYFDGAKNKSADYLRHQMDIEKRVPSSDNPDQTYIAQLNLRSLSVNGGLFFGEAGLTLGVDQNIKTLSADRFIFYRVSAYGAEKKFYEGGRRVENPYRAEFLLGMRNRLLDDDYAAVTLTVGQNSDGLTKDTYQHRFLGFRHHARIIENLKWRSELLAGAMAYKTTDTKTSDATKVTLTVNLTYDWNRYAFHYSFNYDDVRSSSLPYAYKKTIHGVKAQWTY